METMSTINPAVEQQTTALGDDIRIRARTAPRPRFMAPSSAKSGKLYPSFISSHIDIDQKFITSYVKLMTLTTARE